MKRVLFILSCVVCIGVFTGFQAGLAKRSPEPEKKSCRGYEIIEAGKGINCYGDTIKLMKRAGFYELAANHSIE